MLDRCIWETARGFTEENLLSVREVQIELSLKSLFLDKEISVISLELIEPKLHLIKTETGDNWSDIQSWYHNGYHRYLDYQNRHH